ncbi:hypothetical protein [Aureliella helgolandensis]|uniref:Uncharacterized protein n=1 Tax=Aureliella helgolandensis TaxID=2527968 RepID=A0A518GBA1_9BACT|nr:hypothetical protein [Aureliella helgolandensis]QDV25864.1 hypothetical protein Q31a_41920 [Aureliella helgolandensis]
MLSSWTTWFFLALVATVTQVVSGGSDEKTQDGPVKGRTAILGTSMWDIETNKQGDEKSCDVWWEQVNAREQFLAPRNGAALFVLGKIEFDKITREDLEALKYSDKKVANESLVCGAVLALRTKEGNFAKLKVVKYRELHDFSFPEAKLLSADWKAFALKQPNRKTYHLEVEWVLYRK